MSIEENIELRLILKHEDPLYKPFSEIKDALGIKSNTEVARFIITQISKIPISELILDLKMENLSILRDKQMATEEELKELEEFEKKR